MRQTRRQPTEFQAWPGYLQSDSQTVTRPVPAWITRLDGAFSLVMPLGHLSFFTQLCEAAVPFGPRSKSLSSQVEKQNPSQIVLIGIRSLHWMYLEQSCRLSLGFLATSAPH